MAVTTNAVASPRQLYQGQPGTSVASLNYTSPGYSSNVTSPSATAYITEILFCNTTDTAATISLFMGGTTAAFAFVYNLTVEPYDVIVMPFQEHTMIPAGTTLYGSQGTSGAITVTMSGAEVQ